MNEIMFKPLKARCRATFAAGGVEEARLGQIDKENEVLHDVQITLEGEALGHGVWLDRQFCEDCAEQGNAMGDAGVKVRFGHPAMCSDALGTYLGRAKNFRVVDLTRKDGTQAAGVIADVYLAAEAHKAPSGDLAEWVMETAENSPDTFGQSIVFTYSDYKVKDADGNDHSMRLECEDDDGPKKTRKEWKDQSADGKVYAVLGKLHGTDFTDTPAATDGVFSSGDLASEAESMLEEHPQILEVLKSNPDSVCQFLTRIGILDLIESKRVSNLQSAKDHEIAALKDALAAKSELLDKTVSDSSADFLRQKEEFETKHKELGEKLNSAEAEIERLTGVLDQAKSDLDSKVKQLAKVNKTLAMLGHSVNKCPVEKQNSWTNAREHMASLPCGERAAFYAAHKDEIDNNK